MAQPLTKPARETEPSELGPLPFLTSRPTEGSEKSAAADGIGRVPRVQVIGRYCSNKIKSWLSGRHKTHPWSYTLYPRC